jgi:hypothetical protein
MHKVCLIFLLPNDRLYPVQFANYLPSQSSPQLALLRVEPHPSDFGINGLRGGLHHSEIPRFQFFLRQRVADYDLHTGQIEKESRRVEQSVPRLFIHFLAQKLTQTC